MTAWWNAPEYDRAKPMVFPDRRDRLRQEVIRVAPERENGDRTHKADERVRVFVGR